MYATGVGIKPWRATRAGASRSMRRLLAAVAAVSALSAGLALAAHGSPQAGYTTVVVQPGDTLWSMAAEHYPCDDVRIRVDDVERANGRRGPAREAGEARPLPGDARRRAAGPVRVRR